MKRCSKVFEPDFPNGIAADSTVAQSEVCLPAKCAKPSPQVCGSTTRQHQNIYCALLEYLQGAGVKA